MTRRRVGLADLPGWAVGAGAVVALPALRPLGALAVALLLAIAVARPRTRRTSIVLATCLVVGAVVGAVRVHVLAEQPLAGRIGSAVVDGRVEVGEAWRGSGPSRIAIGRLLGPGGGPVLLRVDGPRPPRGTLAVVSGTLRAPRPASGSGFDERRWLARQGVHAVLRVDAMRIAGTRGGALGIADRLRVAALGVLDGAGGGDPGAIVAGLAFGADAGLSRAAVDDLRASGLAHLMAVSGGNVALLIALVVLSVWVAGGSRRAALVTAIGLVALYVAIVGSAPGVVRAGIAGTAGCIAWLLGRPRDAWRALGVGFGLLLAWNPWTILDPGLQLSFAAVAAILLLAPLGLRLGTETVVPRVMAAFAVATVAATVATAPIAWWHFGRAAVVAALPANVLAAPAVPLTLWSGLLAVAVAPVAPAAGYGLAWAAQWPARWILLSARLGAWVAEATPLWLVLLAMGAAAAVTATLLPRRVGWPHVRRAPRPGLPAARHGPRQDPARGRAAAGSLPR